MEDNLSVTVTTASASGSFANYYRGEIEEDTWHPAILKEIVPVEGNFKGNKYPAWNWVYELQDEEFTIEDNDNNEVQAQVIEKTSQKFTGHPRTSRAYERYCQLAGEEPEPGEEVSLKSLFGVACKIMIKNTDSGKLTKDKEPIIYHNIEKVSAKGSRKEKKLIKKGKLKKSSKKEQKPDLKQEPEKESGTENGDIFEDIF